MPTQGRAPACTRVCICLYSAAPVWLHLLIDYACLGSCHVPSQGRAAACTRVCMCLHSAVYRCKLIRLALGPVTCLLRVALLRALGSACACTRQHLISWRLPWVLSYAYSGSRSRVHSGLYCRHGRECPKMHFQRRSIALFVFPSWSGMPTTAFSARIHSVLRIVNMVGNAQKCISSADPLRFCAFSKWSGMPRNAFSLWIPSVFCIANVVVNVQLSQRNPN